MDQLLYLQDPLCLEFEAVILQKRSLPDGRRSVILDRTYFYPTGGGQEHDTGSLGEERVLEVFKDEAEGVLVHVVDRELPLGPIHAIIDRERRLRHMQHHTAQHLLTQCFIRLFNTETVSANINGYSPSTLDLAGSGFSKTDLERVELLANQVIYEDRLVKTYFITPEQIPSIPLRKPPSVTEDIRIVEIDGYDYSACGGTHCSRTGMIGVVKIVKTELLKEKTRIHFIAGSQAFEVFRSYHEIVSNLAAQLSVHPQELVTIAQRQLDQLKSTQKEMQALRLEKLTLEARDLAAQAEIFAGYRLIMAAFEQRPVNEIRTLAGELKALTKLIALIATYDGQKIALVTLCSSDTNLNARELLNRQLSELGGKGGGDQSLAQGGGPATADQFKDLFTATKPLLLEMISLR